MQVLNWTKQGAYSFWLATHLPIDLTQIISQIQLLIVVVLFRLSLLFSLFCFSHFIADIDLTWHNLASVLTSRPLSLKMFSN